MSKIFVAFFVVCIFCPLIDGRAGEDISQTKEKDLCTQTGGAYYTADNCPECPKDAVCETCFVGCQCPAEKIWDEQYGCVESGSESDRELTADDSPVYTLSINNIQFSTVINDPAWTWDWSYPPAAGGDVRKVLVEHCFRHFLKIEPMYNLEFLNQYRTSDRKYLFFEFEVHPPLDLAVVYVFSVVLNDFIGRFYVHPSAHAK